MSTRAAAVKLLHSLAEKDKRNVLFLLEINKKQKNINQLQHSKNLDSLVDFTIFANIKLYLH
jgi:hypothetical protein